MNLKKTCSVVFTAILLAGTAAIPPAQAGEEAPVRIPATSAAIWQAIDQQTAALSKAIQMGGLTEVHPRAFAIRDLVAALPARSGSLPSEKLAQVKENVKFVATLAQRLDATGDAKDKAGTEANFKKLQEVLAAIRADYSKTAGK
ncbi:MAG: hypothetical protein K8F27_15775 [Sulfuricellaceae bacterium]|nr:hypothetical protein [Sulfuricellaceae bacterium]